MKVLWFTNTSCGAASQIGRGSQFGGWLTSLEAKLAAEPGIELHVSFYTDAELDDFEFRGVHYHPINRALPIWGKIIRKLDQGARAEKGEVQRILDVIHRVQPDIVHIHGTEDNFGLVQTETNRPVLISMQGIINPYLIQYFSGTPLHRAAIKFPLLALRSKYFGYKVMEKQARREKRILSNAKTVLGRTAWDRRVTSVLAPHVKYWHSDEVLRSPFYSTDWKMPGNARPKLVSIQSGGFYKGFETILETARHLKSECGFDFSWDVIGINQKSSTVQICEAVTGIGSNDVGINLLGIKSESQVADFISESDLFIHVSHIENSPNSVCEAMLIGIPVIASSSGGTPSLISDGSTGVLYQAGDYFALSGAILELWNKPDQMKSIGKAGKESAKKRHDPETIVKELIGIYREEMNHPTASR